VFFRRHPIDITIKLASIDVDEIQQQLETIVSNQELFDAYAAQITEQNSQIKAAVAVIVSEIGKLQAAASTPLDTTKMDAAISALTAAVDEVEAIPTPAADEEQPEGAEGANGPASIEFSVGDTGAGETGGVEDEELL